MLRSKSEASEQAAATWGATCSQMRDSNAAWNTEEASASVTGCCSLIFSLVTRLCESRSGEKSGIAPCSSSSPPSSPRRRARLVARRSVGAPHPSKACSSSRPALTRAAPASASGSASRRRRASATFAVKRGVVVSAGKVVFVLGCPRQPTRRNSAPWQRPGASNVSWCRVPAAAAAAWRLVSWE